MVLSTYEVFHSLPPITDKKIKTFVALSLCRFVAITDYSLLLQPSDVKLVSNAYKAWLGKW